MTQNRDDFLIFLVFITWYEPIKCPDLIKCNHAEADANSVLNTENFEIAVTESNTGAHIILLLNINWKNTGFCFW